MLMPSTTEEGDKARFLFKAKVVVLRARRFVDQSAAFKLC